MSAWSWILPTYFMPFTSRVPDPGKLDMKVGLGKAVEAMGSHGGKQLNRITI